MIVLLGGVYFVFSRKMQEANRARSSASSIRQRLFRRHRFQPRRCVLHLFVQALLIGGVGY